MRLRLPRRKDQEIKLEIQSHLDMATRDRIERGEAPEQASASARQEFGNVALVTEATRELWVWTSFERLLQDLRHGARILVRNPGFTIAAVLTLALGIGANSAIFSVVNAALLRALPYRDAGQLVHLWETRPQENFPKREASYPDYLDWQQSDVFSGIAGYNARSFTVFSADAPERVRGAAATADFFHVLGVEPVVGRTFQKGEDAPGAAPVAVLSYGLWQRRFGGNMSIPGQQILLNGESYTVVGVLPAQFNFASVGAADVWVPLVPSAAQRDRRYSHWLNVIARLKPSASLETARDRMTTIAAHIAAEDPGSHAGASISIVPLREEFTGPIRPVLYLLLAAVGLVLLIACANVANLLLTRAVARRKEIALRAALGASRWRITRQLLTESILLALLGGSLGLVLGLWGTGPLVHLIPPELRANMPYLEELSLDHAVLGFTIGVSLLTGVVFGLAPAMQAARADLDAALREGTRSTGARASVSMRNAIVISEIALAVVLLVGAGLLAKSLTRMLAVNPGFRTDDLLTMRFSLPASRYADVQRAAAFQQDLLQRIEDLPGVKGAATTSNLPLSGDGGTGTPQIVGRTVPGSDFGESHLRTVSIGYFDVMGLPLVSGRLFTPRDDMKAPNVVLVNQTFATKILPGADPLGQRLTFRFTAGQPPFEIIGVVGDEKVTSLDASTTPVIYFPYLQGPQPTMNLVVRSSVAPEILAASIQREFSALDREVPLYAVQMMSRLIANAPATFIRRYPAYLTGVFAVVALVLAIVGIYTVIAYSVSQRTHELAIRLALGARASDVLWLVLRQGLLLALIGIGAGLAGALALTSLLTKLLFGISSADPPVYTEVSTVLLVVALAASYIPARRATKLNPITALRCE